MELENNPWAAIGNSATEGELRARRVDSTHPHSFFWALNSEGKKLLVLHSREVFETSRELPSLKGVALTLSEERLVLRLQDAASADIFVKLCHSIVGRTRQTFSDDELLDATLTQLAKWQAFLSKSTPDLLSESELRGLIGELHFLFFQLIPRFGNKSISFWLGPSGSPQDFSFGNKAFEVKTKLTGTNEIIQISNCEQLWSTAANLYLVFYSIGETVESDPSGCSAPSLISAVYSTLKDTDAINRFDDQLLLLGYVDHPVYHKKLFRLSGPSFFEVKEGFPRLGPILPVGVASVSYGIRLNACKPFECVPVWE